ncbi:DUF6126 family protein [Streptomyces sp. NPDC057654]|uniref:DUF6126 family protein n=1 Tax=Streptomyces sp. NPDC057654 TaxID=3346196 RepID=UPI0036B69756
MSDATRDVETERAPGSGAAPKATEAAVRDSEAAGTTGVTATGGAESAGIAESAQSAAPDETTGSTEPAEPAEHAEPAEPADESVQPPAEKMVEEDRAPMAFTIRVFIYLVAVHFIVGFFFLIFYLAGARSH